MLARWIHCPCRLIGIGARTICSESSTAIPIVVVQLASVRVSVRHDAWLGDIRLDHSSAVAMEVVKPLLLVPLSPHLTELRAEHWRQVQTCSIACWVVKKFILPKRVLTGVLARAWGRIWARVSMVTWMLPRVRTRIGSPGDPLSREIDTEWPHCLIRHRCPLRVLLLLLDLTVRNMLQLLRLQLCLRLRWCIGKKLRRLRGSLGGLYRLCLCGQGLSKLLLKLLWRLILNVSLLC